jgi:amidase
MTDIAFQSATELVRRIKDREISSQELLQLYFDRIDRYNGDINAVIFELREEAMVRAKAADEALARGEDWGDLHGLPMTVKESYGVEGTPSTWGDPAFKDNINNSDALPIQRL